MSDSFLGELRLMSFNFPPKGWAMCDGQVLPINQNQALFSLLGTMYGGNGQTTFALPDLRGRTPIHVDAGFAQGQLVGSETHAITSSEMPLHTHLLTASSAGADQANPTGFLLGAANSQYHAPTDLTTLAPASITTVGGGLAHENRHPSLALNWCIALVGIFPSRN